MSNIVVIPQPSSGGTVTSVSGTLNRITSTGGTTPVIDISPNYVGQASITTLGTITTGVWNGTAIDATHGGTGQTTYTTGDILYASAANTLSKLAIGSANQVLTIVGGVPTWQTGVSGTVTSVSGTANRITSTGGTTPVIDISASYVGQTSITTLGTIATGTWNATAIGATFGGTSQTTYAAGDILYASASNTLSKLTATTNGFVLTLSGGLPVWAAAAAGTVTSVSGTSGRITSTGGATPVINIDTALVTAALEFLGGNGSVTNPTYSFASDTNSGLYRKGADQVGFVAGGSEMGYYDATGLTMTISYILDGITAGYAGSEEHALQAGVQTTDATVTNLATVTINQGEMIAIQGLINGFRSTFAEAVSVRFFASARRATGGNVTLIGTPVTEALEDSTGIPNVQIDADTGTQTIRIRVQGETSKTFNWVGTYRYHKTLTNS